MFDVAIMHLNHMFYQVLTWLLTAVIGAPPLAPIADALQRARALPVRVAVALALAAVTVDPVAAAVDVGAVAAVHVSRNEVQTCPCKTVVQKPPQGSNLN